MLVVKHARCPTYHSKRILALRALPHPRPSPPRVYTSCFIFYTLCPTPLGSTPRSPSQDRGRFLRAVLRGALTGLSTLHRSGLVHGSLSPSAVLLSTVDDRSTDRGQGWLCELAFCRDAPSLELVYRAAADGTSV